MTIGQADTINKLYKSYNDTIIAYKDSLSLKNNLYATANNKLRVKEDSVNIYRFHIQNIKSSTGIDLTKPNSIIKKCWVSLSFNPT